MEQHSSNSPTGYGATRGTALPAAVLAAVLGAAAIAPARAEELVALGKKTGVGARAISLGEAFTAVADDYSALYYNAAGMTQLSRSEFALNLGYGYSENRASFDGGSPRKGNLENTRLNAASLVLTDGRRWALGLGYYVPVTFDDPVQYNARGVAYAYNAEGQMEHYRMALAYKVSEQVSLGLAASAISGEEELEINDVGSARYLEEYTGYNLEPSVLFHLSDHFSIGGSAVVAERLELVDTYQEQGTAPIENQYDIRHPFQTRLGIAFQSGFTQVSADWHGDFWNSYEYTDARSAYQAGDSRLSQPPCLQHRAGAAPLPPRARAARRLQLGEPGRSQSPAREPRPLPPEHGPGPHPRQERGRGPRLPVRRQPLPSRARCRAAPPTWKSATRASR